MDAVMESGRQYHNLALIGFMGVGKSVVGQQVAALLGFSFLDTDQAIEQEAGKPITRIFEEDGEVGFREQERALVQRLASLRGWVIATGGGLGANAGHLADLKTHALTVWLWASPETVWERVRHQSHRPLLQTPDPQARIRGLLQEREPVYREADVIVNVEQRTAREVAQLVVQQFRSTVGQAGT